MGSYMGLKFRIQGLRFKLLGIQIAQNSNYSPAVAGFRDQSR